MQLAKICRILIRLAAVFMAFLAAGDTLADSVSPECGESAMYMFLKLHNVSTNLESVMNQVAHSSEEGYSFGELQKIARAHGLETVGIRVVELGDFPKEPMIAALRHDSEGHFVVIDPIEGSPTLVQVYDQLADPFVTNIDTFMSNSHWTGRLLVKKHSHMNKHIFILLASSLFLLAIFAIGSRRIKSDFGLFNNFK